MAQKAHMTVSQGEIKWASENTRADQSVTISREQDTIEVTVTHVQANKTWIINPETDPYRFQWKGPITLPSIASFDRPSFVAKLIIRSYRFGISQPVISESVIRWSPDIYRENKIFKDLIPRWVVQFPYDQRLLAIRLPGMHRKRIRFAWPVNRGRASVLTKTRHYKEMTPRRLVAHLLQYGQQGTSAFKRKFPDRTHLGAFAKALARPNPQVINIPGPVWNENYQTAYQENNPVLPREVFYRSFSGVRTPGFRSLNKSEFPVNNYHMVSRITNNTIGTYRRTRVTPPNIVEWFANGGPSGEMFTVAPVSIGHSSFALNKAVNKLIENAESDVDNIAQDMVQGNQLVRMIANTASRLTKSNLALRHGNFSAAIDHLWHGKHSSIKPGVLRSSKSLAENWLELQYGWKPLLKDIEGATRDFQNLMKRHSFVKQVNSSGKNVDLYKFDLFAESPAIRIGRSEYISVTKVRLGMRYKVVDAQKAFFAQTGFTNPINLGWEVIPYSFVVDWFLPIGPFLSGMTAWEGLSFVDGFQTQYTRLYTLANIRYDGKSNQFSGFDLRIRGFYEAEWKLHDRVKLTTFPRQRLPTFKNPLSVTHALNALALLRSIW